MHANHNPPLLPFTRMTMTTAAVVDTHDSWGHHQPPPTTTTSTGCRSSCQRDGWATSVQGAQLCSIPILFTYTHKPENAETRLLPRRCPDSSTSKARNPTSSSIYTTFDAGEHTLVVAITEWQLGLITWHTYQRLRRWAICLRMCRIGQRGAVGAKQA